MKKIIIIGASSGIGRELAIIFSEQGYEVGLVARRLELIHELQSELQTKSYAKQLDITEISKAISSIESLFEEMQNVDLVIINSGVYFHNPELGWSKDKTTIEVNVLAFTAMANTALKYFLNKNCGQLVGISSVSGIRGESYSPAYSASKAFISNFLEGLSHRMSQEKKAIFVTDIQPGWVDTDMAKGEKTFWMASAKEAAKQIYSAINKKQKRAYITSRWRWYAYMLKLSPRWFYDRFL